jgi:hypothetical protein
MAVVDRKSGYITNRDASPRVANPSHLRGMLREAIGYIAAAADDSATNVGLHRTIGDGGAVVDADFFASAVDLSGGPFSLLDLVREAGTSGWTLANAESMIWQGLGLTSDPGIEYDVTATISTNFNGGSGLLLKGKFVV